MVLQNFEGNWKTFLFTVEKDLVRLLLVESGKAIANIESEMETDLKKEDLVGFQKKKRTLECKYGKHRSSKGGVIGNGKV